MAGLGLGSLNKIIVGLKYGYWEVGDIIGHGLNKIIVGLKSIVDFEFLNFAISLNKIIVGLKLNACVH